MSRLFERLKSDRSFRCRRIAEAPRTDKKALYVSFFRPRPRLLLLRAFAAPKTVISRDASGPSRSSVQAIPRRPVSRGGQARSSRSVVRPGCLFDQLRLVPVLDGDGDQPSASVDGEGAPRARRRIAFVIIELAAVGSLVTMLLWHPRPCASRARLGGPRRARARALRRHRPRAS